MNCRMREIPMTIEEVRGLMRQEKAKRGLWIGIAIGVVIALVGVVIWVAKRKEKDLKEHYEYFDDEDEFDDDYDEFDESIYDDEDEDDDQIEYVKLKDFMQEDTDKESEEE